VGVSHVADQPPEIPPRELLRMPAYLRRHQSQSPTGLRLAAPREAERIRLPRMFGAVYFLAYCRIRLQRRRKVTPASFLPLFSRSDTREGSIPRRQRGGRVHAGAVLLGVSAARN
jgi:hypothetical protein